MQKSNFKYCEPAVVKAAGFRAKRNKKFHIFLCLFLIAACMLLLPSPTEAAVKATSVSISQTTYVLQQGKSVTLKATIYPSNVTNRKVTWKSSRPKVAAVSSTGKVTAKKAGTTKITVTAKDGSKKNASITVKVVNKLNKISKIRFTNTKKEVTVGKTLKLKTSVTPSKATLKTLKYTSSNTKVAVVSKSGTVTAKKSGRVKITATAQDGSKKKASITLKVLPAKVQSIMLSATKLSMDTGSSKKLAVAVTPSYAENRKVSYTSSASSVVSVSGDGLLQAKKAGTAVITVKATDGSGKKATCTVTVKDILLTSATLTGSDLYFTKSGSDYSWTTYVGRTKILYANVSPANATNKAFRWESTNPAVAKVENGVITGIKEGTTTIQVISADAGKVLASCMLEVGPETGNAKVDVGTDADALAAYELLFRDTTGLRVVQHDQNNRSRTITNSELVGAQIALGGTFRKAENNGKTAFFNLLELMKNDKENKLLGLFFDNAAIQGLPDSCPKEDEIRFQVVNGESSREVICSNFKYQDTLENSDKVTVELSGSGNAVTYPSRNVAFQMRTVGSSNVYYMYLAMMDNGSFVCEVSDSDIEQVSRLPYIIMLERNTSKGQSLYLQVDKFVNDEIRGKFKSFPDFSNMDIYNLYADEAMW